MAVIAIIPARIAKRIFIRNRHLIQLTAKLSHDKIPPRPRVFNSTPTTPKALPPRFALPTI
jgi:hypothetical protein